MDVQMRYGAVFKNPFHQFSLCAHCFLIPLHTTGPCYLAALLGPENICGMFQQSSLLDSQWTQGIKV